LSSRAYEEKDQEGKDRALLRSQFDSEYYKSQNPDVVKSGADPLTHFMEFGWKEGRDPNDWFSTQYYLKTNPDVEAQNVNPFLHYLQFGQDQGRRPTFNYSTEDNLVSEAFDVSYYKIQNPDVEKKDIDPLKHFLETGWKEGRDPNDWFSTRYYRKANPDVENLNINPFLHYLQFGQAEGRRPAPPKADLAKRIFQERSKATAKGPYFEPLNSAIGLNRTPLAKVLAYYLPQFHATPENDAFWGEGFTEWNNVARGQPRFAGHVQPVIPRDLGFYNLDDPEVMRKQIEMAAAAGIHAFCFYYYRFGGHRVLEKPIEHMLQDPTLDFPFVLMWANENWTRAWDGLEKDVLLQQDYSAENDVGLVDDLARHFVDSRYMRIGDRPLFFIYRPGQIPNAAAVIANWRSLFMQRHNLSPLIFMVQGFGDNDPTLYGLDGAIEFPPHKICQDQPVITGTVDLLDPDFAGYVLRYDDVIGRATAEPVPDFPLIRTTVPHWDNEARRPGNCLVMHGSTPTKFEAWVRQSVVFAREHPVHGEAIVAVNAWNEWAEGAYLEPDVHYGGAYLNALSRAVHGVPALERGDPQ